MTDNLKRIIQEFESLKGQFVITEFWKVARLVAIASDDMDYYYVTYDGRTLSFHTCVGSVVRLKGKIDDKAYNEFIRLAEINHLDQINVWMNNRHEERKIQIQEHKAELMALKGNDKFLTEVCWDLN